MVKLEAIYDIAVNQYNKLADLIEKVYAAMKKNDAVRISKKAIMENYDFFIQCLLCKVAVGDGDIDHNELSFIQNIARYEDFFKKFDEADDEKIIKTVGSFLEEVPLFIQLLATADKSLEENGMEQKYSKMAFAVLLNVVVSIASIDRKIEENEFDEAIKCLEPIIDFYNANGIKFMEEGKK